MKNLLGSFKTRESQIRDIEFLSENEMFQIRGGAEVKPKSRPREILDTEEI